MKIVNFLILGICTIALIACETKKKETPQASPEVPKIVTKPAPVEVQKPIAPLPPKRDLVIDNQVITSSVSLGHYMAGDIIEIELSGTRTAPKFSDTYEVVYQAQWDKGLCLTSAMCGGCITNSNAICYTVHQQGPCTQLYRNQLQDVKYPILFEKTTDYLSAKLKIGDNTYSIGEVMTFNGTSIVARFKVSREMLTTSDEVFFVVNPEPDLGIVKVGFAGYKDCDGSRGKNFETDGPTDSQEVVNQAKTEYKAKIYHEHSKE